MNALILAYTPETYATDRLLLHLRARGHWALAVSPLDCSLVLRSGAMQLSHRGERLPHIDVVFLRGLTYYDQGILVPRTVELSLAAALADAGALSFNTPTAKATASDKLAALQRFAAARLPIPATAVVWSEAEFERVATALHLPLVLKVLDGTRGAGVVRCDSLPSARSTFEALRVHGMPFVVQQFVSNAVNIRALVIDGRVVAALKVTPAANDFRANIGKGAVAEATVLSEVQLQLALAAAGCIGLDVAGVDMLDVAAGPLLLEANSVPGLESIDQCCSIDAALLIAKLAEARYTQHASTARRPGS